MLLCHSRLKNPKVKQTLMAEQRVPNLMPVGTSGWVIFEEWEYA